MTAIEKARAYVDEGRATVSPKEAADVLGCRPYALNVAAQLGRLNLPHFFSGRNLKISAAGLLAFVAGTDINYARPQWLEQKEVRP